jgi:hypothetical protein
MMVVLTLLESGRYIWHADFDRLSDNYLHLKDLKNRSLLKSESMDMKKDIRRTHPFGSWLLLRCHLISTTL